MRRPISRLIGTSAALVALVACQDATGPVQVLLRPSSTAVAAAQPAIRMTVPRHYMSHSPARAGVEKLHLEIARAEATPLRIELTVREPFPNGLGDRRRDDAMNQPPGSPRQLIVPPPDVPPDMIGYIYANLPGAMAYYFKVNNDGVFVDCSERPRCRGFQTWRNVLDVQYEYTRASPDDPRPMNAEVQKLLESFGPTAVPTSQ